MNLRAVWFDADGVVQAAAVGWREELARLCQDRHRIEEFLADVFAAERPCLTGQGDFADALVEVLERWESTASLEEALKVWTLIQPDAAVLAVVSSVRDGGLRAGLATNQQNRRAAFMTETLGYGDVFDDLLYSCVVGHAKPDPDYFLRCLDRTGLAGGEVLFFDDHPANVAAARDAGLHAEVHEPGTGAAGLRERLDRYGIRLMAG
jgi:putative hydrolase of the HAD superfamily